MKILKFWFPALLYSGIIFFVSGIPNIHLEGGIPFLDKVVHIMEYIPLGLLTAHAIRQTKPRLSLQTVWLIAIGICALYGISDEFHQLFVPGRTFSLGDWTADIIGSAIGGLIFRNAANQTI